MDITDAIPDMEKADGSAYLLEQLNSAIGNGEFIDKIQYEPHEPGNVLMLTIVWHQVIITGHSMWSIKGDKAMMIREMFADDINRKQKAFDNAMAAIIVGIMMYVVAVLL